jgi:hypothetical protein
MMGLAGSLMAVPSPRALTLEQAGARLAGSRKSVGEKGDVMASEGQEVHGGPKSDFFDAVKDAWDKVPKDGQEKKYVVVNTFVHGTNPLTGYSVILRPA